MGGTRSSRKFLRLVWQNAIGILPVLLSVVHRVPTFLHSAKFSYQPYIRFFWYKCAISCIEKVEYVCHFYAILNRVIKNGQAKTYTCFLAGVVIKMNVYKIYDIYKRGKYDRYKNKQRAGEIQI